MNVFGHNDICPQEKVATAAGQIEGFDEL
jgi:hypothetical protein